MGDNPKRQPLPAAPPPSAVAPGPLARGASPLSLRLRLRSAQGGALILSPGGGEESGKEGACPTSVIPARCSFLSPSPLGGRGKGEGGCWRHLEPLGASPLSLRLRLRSAQGGALILSPGGGEESGKEGARLLFCHSRARLTCLPRLPVRARRQTGRTRRRQASGSAMSRRRPSPSPLPCNGHAREGKKKVRRARG